ncbi:MAG: magnesium transporter MgtE N-terminal domain-containing protein, partial [Gammaproteobacteria bacterium]
MPETEPQQTDPSQTKPRADGRPRSLDRPRRSWQEIETRLLRVTRELSSRSWPKIARGLNSLSPGHAVHLLESSPPYQRNILWSLLDDELEAEVTPLLSAEVRRQLLSKMGADELHQLANRMDIAELVATINELPDAIAKNVLNQVNLDRKQRIERLLVWPAGTAGSMISPEIPSLPYNSYVYLAQQYIQEHHEEFAGLQEIPVIDARQHYKGTISLV